MALQIAVVAGPGTGTRHALRKDLVRIGSASACEISLPTGDLAAHAASLEIAGDICRVYNRSAQPLLCAGRSLAPQQATAWPLGTDLELIPGVILRIEPLAAASPSVARPAWEHEADTEPEATATRADPRAAATTGKPANPQSTAQLVITLACVAASALLLYNKFAGSEEKAPAARSRVTLNEVLDQIDAAPANEQWSEIRRAIQDGYRQERSGDQENARKRYRRVIQIMLAQRALSVGSLKAESPVSPEQLQQLAGIADELPEGVERTVFLYAFGRL